MKKGFILSVLIVLFVFCGVNTSAKFCTSEFIPEGFNYIDPYNFYYSPITNNKHGYVKSIRKFNVSNLDEIAVGVTVPEAIELISFTYTSYDFYQNEIATYDIEVDDTEVIYFEDYDEELYYMSVRIEVLLIDEEYSLNDMNNYYITDYTERPENLSKEDLLYKGPYLDGKTILDEELNIETNISDPISFESLNNNILVLDMNDQDISEEKEIITNTYGTSDYQIGEWVIEYQVTNSVNLTSTLKINIRVKDDIAPEISGITEFKMKTTDLKTVEDVKKELIASDNYDGDITDKIEVLEDSFTNRIEKIGVFPVKYVVYDSEGNCDEHLVEITVVEGDKTEPVISGTLDHVVYTDDPKTEEYFLEFVVVTDDYTENIQEKLQVIDNSYQYNTDKIGNYKIILKVVDDAKNFTIGYINITVLERSYPVFILDVVDVTIPLKANMQNIDGIISYLKKTNYLNMNDVEIISDDYTANKNTLGSHLIKLEQDDKILNVRINVKDAIEYQNNIQSISLNNNLPFLNVIYKKCVKIRDFIKEFFSALFN